MSGEERHPEFSIVIGARDAEESLARCLESLLDVDGIASGEIIAATHPPVSHELRTRFPRVDFIASQSPCNLAELRALALARVDSPWIFLTEPFCTFSRDLITRLMKAAAQGADVTGGSVEVDEGVSHVGWATAFFEYGQFFPPLGPDQIREIPCNNVLYRRAILEPLDRWKERGFWKYFAHQGFRDAGNQFRVQPERRVRHHPTYRLLPFLERTYHHSRAFGGMRGAGVGFARRVVWTLRTPVIPALSVYRLIKSCWPKTQYRSRLFRYLPIMLVIYSAWAVGEAVGTALGAGRSAEDVY